MIFLNQSYVPKCYIVSQCYVLISPMISEHLFYFNPMISQWNIWIKLGYHSVMLESVQWYHTFLVEFKSYHSVVWIHPYDIVLWLNQYMILWCYVWISPMIPQCQMISHCHAWIGPMISHCYVMLDTILWYQCAIFEVAHDFKVWYWYQLMISECNVWISPMISHCHGRIIT